MKKIKVKSIVDATIKANGKSYLMNDEFEVSPEIAESLRSFVQVLEEVETEDSEDKLPTKKADLEELAKEMKLEVTEDDTVKSLTEKIKAARGE